MSPVLPFDIFTLIIDIIGESKDTNLLKELALVSHSFLHICSKHLFATVELLDTDPKHYLAEATNKRFVKLLRSRPDVVNYIRRLTYKKEHTNHNYHSSQIQSTHPTSGYDPSFIDDDDDDKHLLSPILLNSLRTIPHLNCLTIAAVGNWKTLDSSLSSALLYLMHLPTINHINLSFIRNFPLSSLTSSVNLHRLDISHLSDPHHDDDDDDDDEKENGCSSEIVRPEMMVMLREFHISESSMLTRELLNYKLQDGRLAFDFMDLKRLSMSFSRYEDQWNIRYLLQNAKSLEKLYLSVDFRRNLVGLLSPSAPTLKVLDLTVFLYRFSIPPLAGIWEELEPMAGHNVLESLSFKVKVDGHETVDFIGSVIQKVEEVLVKPGWSALRQVSFKMSCLTRVDKAKLEALQSLPDKYLSRLSKLESVALSYSVDVFKSSW